MSFSGEVIAHVEVARHSRSSLVLNIAFTTRTGRGGEGGHSFWNESAMTGTDKRSNSRLVLIEFANSWSSLP